MLRRYELHNHTTHSDASITCRELLEVMREDQVQVVALTDHNTISGHRELRELLPAFPGLQAVFGMEYTTYYGHILCLNLTRYVPWDRIDRNCPEKLFAACRAAGALTGIAHPFSYGAPFARGCRFDMHVRDFRDVDFIEVFNNPEPLREVNIPALEWWEDLTLRGEHLAATGGMDLHGHRDMSMMFATYLEGDAAHDPGEDLARAVRGRRTWVSRGMALLWTPEEDGFRFHLEDLHKPGFRPASLYLLTIRSQAGQITRPLEGDTLYLPLSDLPPGPVRVLRLYRKNTDAENLICVCPPMT